MASKLAAAKIAAWSGVEAVIADAARPGVLAAVVAGGAGGRAPGSGPASGGCRPASCGSPSPSAPRGRSWSTPGPGGPWSSGAGRCCRPGWCRSRGDFDADDAVEIVGPDGAVFAKGLVRQPARRRWPSGPGGAPTSCPRTSPPRSSTGTTWWSWRVSGLSPARRSPVPVRPRQVR